jgi:DNA-binding transcriptional LysR family regulator
MQDIFDHHLRFCRLSWIVIRPAMNWDDLKIITAVRNKGTYAKAGVELRLDETTVARRLGRIQKALGVPLFDAIDGARKPTPQCEAILAHIEDIARTASKISMIGNHSAGAVGNIRLTSTPSIAEQILAPGLGQFLLANPGLSLELDTSNQNLNFSQWEADLAIRLGKPAKGAFSIRKLTDLKFYLFQPKAMPADAESVICAYPEDLAETPEMRELSAKGFAQKQRLKTSNVRLIRSVIKTRNAIGVLPQHLSADLLQDTRLTATPLKARREVFLLIQPHLKSDPATRLVVD